MTEKINYSKLLAIHLPEKHKGFIDEENWPDIHCLQTHLVIACTTPSHPSLWASLVLLCLEL